MEGIFYVVGVGPGDPELITLKAVRILQSCAVWLTPAARQNEKSTALTIVAGVIDPSEKEVLHHQFPMKKVHIGKIPDPEVREAWEDAAAMIHRRLEAGVDVALPTLGDPAIYCTGFYVCETLLRQHPDTVIKIIPGISAIGDTAAAANTPLCLGDDKVVIIPTVFESERLKEILTQFDSVVFMKVYKAMDRLVPLLEELNLLHRAVLVERTSMEDQRVHYDLKATVNKELHYFSTLIVRKSGTVNKQFAREH